MLQSGVSSYIGPVLEHSIYGTGNRVFHDRPKYIYWRMLPVYHCPVGDAFDLDYFRVKQASRRTVTRSRKTFPIYRDGGLTACVDFS